MERNGESSSSRSKKDGGDGEAENVLVVQEPVVAASCLISGIGLFLPAVVRPMLDSFESSKQVPQPVLSDVVAVMTGKK